MKYLYVFTLVWAYAYAAGVPSDVDAPIVKSDYNHSPDGAFQYVYETGNGIVGHAEGHLKPVDKEQVALSVSGSNAYTAPGGEKIQLSYVADENGYQPQGAHLPTPPPTQPIPEYILRSLEFIAAHPYVEKKH